LARLSTREDSAEVDQLLRCRRVRALAVAARTRTALAGTYDHHFGGSTYRLKVVQGGDRAGYLTGSRSNSL